MNPATQEYVTKGAKDICFTIQMALQNDNGALIGRNGTIELDCMLKDGQQSSTTLAVLERNAGIFPANMYYKWREASITATQSANALVTGWYEPLCEAEKAALDSWNTWAMKIPLRSLEPYYVDPNYRWTQFLSEQRVAVVSSFTETARKQVEHLSEIWGTNTMLPSDVEWHWVQTGHAPSVAQGRNEWPPHIHTWSQAVDHVVLEVIRSGARFALIGCGGLSMPIAKMLKERGIIAIVLGGAIQILFGIKGKRWEKHDTISKFWNDAWIWPSVNETPIGATGIEGGCYWQ